MRGAFNGLRSPFGRWHSSTSVLSIYAVLGLIPKLVLDFEKEFYVVNNVQSTLAAATTHSRASNATMVDSDGLLKWAPHNLLPYTADLTGSSWLKFNVVIANNDIVPPKGVSNAKKLYPSSSGTDRFVYRNARTQFDTNVSNKCRFYAKAAEKSVAYITDSGGNDNLKCFFNLSTGVASIGVRGSDAIMEDVGNGWWLCGYTRPIAYLWFEVGVADSVGDGNVTASGTDGIYIAGLQHYRSDLGGMVNNPATGDSYVPTTDAAVYLPRTGHHIYNGTAWVNEGLLLESEARTNVLLNSGTLSTQNVTVANSPNTLHFTGTGTVTLTGVSTAGPLVGTGTGENNRVSLTFTPTAGTLTVTVSGTVTNGQLEVGSTPSSHIPTSGAAATRAAETLVVPAANMPTYTDAVSIAVEGKMTYADEDTLAQDILYNWNDGTGNNIRARLYTNASNTGAIAFGQEVASVSSDAVFGVTQYTPGINVPFNIASRHGSTFLNGAVSGDVATVNTTMTSIPDLSATAFQIGPTFNGTIGTVRVWPVDITDAGIEEASA